MNDLISRQAAIDAVSDCGICLQKIIDLPSAQPDLDEVYAHAETEAEASFHAQQRWIPCSERLSDEEVLCCDIRGEMIIGYPYQDEESNTGYSAVLDDVVMIDCTAWMPLPEPYREGEL